MTEKNDYFNRQVFQKRRKASKISKVMSALTLASLCQVG